jgi:hypothetical protein
MKDFFRKLGLFLAAWGAWILVPILVAGLIFTGVLISRNNKDEDTTPEVTQNFSPDISRPETTAETPAPTPEAPEPTPVREAPLTGAAPIPASPFIYRSDQLGFVAELPAGTKVFPTGNNEVAFAPASGGQYYTVSSFALTNETIDSIETQLKSSPSVTTTARTNVHGFEAVQFRSPNIPGVGYAILKGQRLYYVTGNLTPELLHNFNMI